jgi:SAM-dependent methyltransferase
MVDSFSPPGAGYRVERRVAGVYNYRLDGMSDLLGRAKGASVFDIGCNRGLVGYDFALNGAARVDGCDIYKEGVETAREVFADLRGCESRFEVVDLTGGTRSLLSFGAQTYDVTLCLATYHKLKRIMSKADLSDLFQYFGRWTKGYFGWRGTSDKPDENDAEIDALDRDLGVAGLRRIHTSYISPELGVAAIWARAR